MGRLLALLLLLSGLVLLVTQGGRLLDLASANRLSLQTLEANAATPAGESKPLSENGACRLAHVTGRFYLVRQEYERALPYLERGVECGVDRTSDRWAWFDLARTQLALGDRPAAAISLANAEGYRYLAGLARQAVEDRDRDGEIELWRLAIEVDPGRQEGYIRLALLVAGDDPDRAEALLQRAIDNNPWEPAAYLALARSYTGRGQLEAAGQVLVGALDYLPGDTEVLRELAANAGARGQASQAIDYYQQAAAASRNDKQRAAAYFAIGELTAADNNWASALTFYRLAVVDDPATPTYLLALAHAYQEQGCPEQAGQLFQRLLSQFPESEMVATAAARLAELAGRVNEPAADCPPVP